MGEFPYLCKLAKRDNIIENKKNTIMEIYLVRHTSVAVPKGTCYGFTDVAVSDSFETEAAVTKKNLEGIAFDAAFTSPLTRASKLAAFCGYADAQRDDRLKEMNMGAWEMKHFDHIEDKHLQEWYNDYLNQPTTDGESFRDLYARVVSFLEELKQKPYKRVVVFAHGGVLICARVMAGLIPMEQGFDNVTPYGGIEKIML